MDDWFIWEERDCRRCVQAHHSSSTNSAEIQQGSQGWIWAQVSVLFSPDADLKRSPSWGNHWIFQFSLESGPRDYPPHGLQIPLWIWPQHVSLIGMNKVPKRLRVILFMDSFWNFIKSKGLWDTNDRESTHKPLNPRKRVLLTKLMNNIWVSVVSLF